MRLCDLLQHVQIAVDGAPGLVESVDVFAENVERGANASGVQAGYNAASASSVVSPAMYRFATLPHDAFSGRAGSVRAITRSRNHHVEIYVDLVIQSMQ